MKRDNLEFRKLVKEAIIEGYKYLIEGIDIDKINKTVSFNPMHEDNVDTSIILNPTYNTINGIPVISIFKRKDNRDKSDGNPLIYALKEINGWTFKNPQEDIISLLKQFIRISEKIKPEYDTIITVPSKNPLNEKFLHRLNKIIKAKYKIKDYFVKLSAEEVWEDHIDWKNLKRDFPDTYEKIETIMFKYFKKMETDNEDTFSYRFISDAKYRKYIKKTLEETSPDAQIVYAPFINDKNILILDDTITSGATISETCENIMNLFVPNSITVITLFSKI